MVEDAHPSSNLINGFQLIGHVTSPATESAYWFSNLYDGTAVTNAFKPVFLRNGNPVSFDYGHGGQLSAPDAFTVSGPHNKIVQTNGLLAGGTMLDFTQILDGTAVDIFRMPCLSIGSNLPDCHHLTYNIATDTATADFDLQIPNSKGYNHARDKCFSWSYNGGPPSGEYIAISNYPSGGYASQGTLWLSLDSACGSGAHDVNLRGNIVEGNTVRSDNGFTGTCPAGHGLTISGGIVTGCN